MLQTSDGGFIVCGLTSSYGAGDSDAYLVRTDASGLLLWSKTYGGVHSDYANSVQPTLDGGYILAGETSSSGAGYSDAYWIKIDSMGNIIWTKTFGGSSFDASTCIVQTADSGYISVGETASFGTGPAHYFNVYLIKTNSLGDTAWTRTFGAVKKDIHGLSVKQTNDGGYILTGYVFNYGRANVTIELIKTDEEGNACSPVTFSQNVEICSGDSIAIGKHTYYNTGTYTDTLSHGMACDSAVTTHLTVKPAPVIIPYATATSICEGTSVSVVATGAYSYIWSGGVASGVYFIPAATATYTVTGTDTNGCSNSATITIVVNALPDVTVNLNSITVTANQSGAGYQWLNCGTNSITAGAVQQSFTPLANGSYAVIISLDGCSDTSVCVAITSVNVWEFSSLHQQLIYPNPAQDSFVIRSSVNGDYHIIDGTGQIVRSLKFDVSNDHTISIEGLSAGVYFIIGAEPLQMTKQKFVIIE